MAYEDGATVLYHPWIDKLKNLYTFSERRAPSFSAYMAKHRPVTNLRERRDRNIRVIAYEI